MKYLSLITLFLVSHLSFSETVRELNDLSIDRSAITEIDLSNKGLYEFPLEILECKNLKKINLSDNGLVKIPKELSRLKNLKELNLSGNQGLSVLDLEELMDSAQFDLSILDLSDCDLIYLPSTLESQSNLQSLNISGNRLFKIPYSLMTFDKMVSLDASDNYLTDISWIVSYWWSLKNIDVSGNKEFRVSSLLLSLSYFDHLNRIVVSKIDYIPSEFQYLSVDELIIRNSVIDDFHRSDISTKIRKLVFDDCIFVGTHEIAKTISESCQPEYLGFNNMKAVKLTPFLSVEADSVAVQNAGILDITPLAKLEKLAWLDVRGNDVSKESVKSFQEQKPKITLLFKEILKPNLGIKLPIEKFAAKPIQQSFSAKNEERIVLGKSVLTVPKNAILDANGNVYNGNVNIEYTEYTNPVDVFLSGITMTSTDADGETLMLSSAGMFNIDATDDNGNQLSVDPNNPIKVKMFTDKKDVNIPVWKLNKDGLWDQVGVDSIYKPFEFDQDIADSVMNQDFEDLAKAQVQFIYDRYVPKIRKNRKLNTFELSFEEYTTSRVHKKIAELNGAIVVPMTDYRAKFLCGQSLVFDGDSVEYYSTLFEEMRAECRKVYKRLRSKSSGGMRYTEAGPNFIQNLKIAPDFENDRMLLGFRYKGKRHIVPFLIKPEETSANMAIRDVQSFYKNYLRADKRTTRWERRMKIKLIPILKRQEIELKKLAQQNEYFRQKAIYDRMMNEMDVTGQGSIQREFEMSGFGLFNCDVRTRMGRPRDVGYALISEESTKQIEDQILGATLIDHDKNGTLRFAPGEKIYLDDAAKSTLIFFFSSTVVGIYQSWKHKLTDDYTVVKTLDISKMSKEEFVKSLEVDE